LEPPVEFPEIKKRYRELVKRHHPDMQTEDATHSGDETIRRLNAAFTLLKGLYAKRKAG
jgi:curved DNA-binding protein CbpA